MKKHLALLIVLVMALSLFAACSSAPAETSVAKTTTTATDAPDTKAPETKTAETTASKEKFLIGFSTDTTTSAWRSKMVTEMEDAVAAHSDELELVVTVAEDDTNKQISDIEDLVAQGIDVLIVSPHVADPITPIVKEVYESGIPVIVVDRAVSGEAFTTFIGASNEAIGRQAGDIIGELMEGEGNIIELQGTAGASPTIGRSEPMHAVLKEKYPNIKFIAEQDCDYNETKAMETMENLLQANPEGTIDLIYAHADNMALGAMKALKAAGRDNEGIKIVSIDGQKQTFEAIKEGCFTGTFTYPWPSEKAVEVALRILHGEEVEKNYELESAYVNADNVDEFYDPNSEF